MSYLISYNHYINKKERITMKVSTIFWIILSIYFTVVPEWNYIISIVVSGLIVLIWNLYQEQLEN